MTRPVSEPKRMLPGFKLEDLKEPLFRDGEASRGNEGSGTGADDTRDESAVSGRKRSRFKRVLMLGSRRIVPAFGGRRFSLHQIQNDTYFRKA